jgi:hypothetical protein
MGPARDPKDRQAAENVLRDIEDRHESVQPLELVKPRKFVRVPTHAVGVASERRHHPRAALALPLRLTQVAGEAKAVPVTLVTKNISSSGVYFLAPLWIEPGTGIEFEVALVYRPFGCGTVRLQTAAHVVRTDPVETAGWHGFAASFDDIAFRRDDVIPLRFKSH